MFQMTLLFRVFNLLPTVTINWRYEGVSFLLFPSPLKRAALLPSSMVASAVRVVVLMLLIALHSACNFIQSPMEFGPLSFLQGTNGASMDFGRIVFNSPSLVLRPQSAGDISLLLGFLSTSPVSKLTVAARGAGHSIHGQAQAPDGIVVEMDSLPSSITIEKTEMEETGGSSYADVGGGTLWIELLEESMKHGLAPRSWTDYLYLTIGGTLSNGGISGQTFKWDGNTSAVLPNSHSNILYLVGILRSAAPATDLHDILQQNRRLVHLATAEHGHVGGKQYLAHHPGVEEWRRHFGEKWELFASRKSLYDPLCILSPGHNIFQRKLPAADLSGHSPQ